MTNGWETLRWEDDEMRGLSNYSIPSTAVPHSCPPLPHGPTPAYLAQLTLSGLSWRLEGVRGEERRRQLWLCGLCLGGRPSRRGVAGVEGDGMSPRCRGR